MTIYLTELRRLADGATPLPLTAIRYEHGGGRLYKEDPRTLVADFFDEDNRELFIAMRNALPALLAIAECAQKLDELIGGKQLAQIGPEVAREVVFCKRTIQDALAGMGGEGADE